MRDELLAGMQLETGADGRLWIRRAGEDASSARNQFHCFAAGAGPWLSPLPHPRAAGFSLTFEDTREFAPDQVWPEYLEMLEGYGLAEAARAALPTLDAAVPVRATLHLRLAGESVLRWTMLPAEREDTYFDAFHPVAAALQAVSRRWAPMVWFEHMEASSELFQMQARLAFAATPVSRLQPPATFAYEVLDEASRRRALDGARQALPVWLDRARQRMLAAGHLMRSKHYASRSLHVIMKKLFRHRRTYDSFLLVDAQNIDQLTLLATAGRTLRQAAVAEPARAVRRLGEFMADFASCLARRARRMFPDGDLPEYPSLLIIEATHAIAPEYPLEAALILSQNGREVVLRNS